MDQKKVLLAYSEIRSPRADAWESLQTPAYHAYRKKWIENPENGVIPDFPLHLDIETTSRCNLLCPMCARAVKISKSRWREGQDMSFALFKKIIDEGAENGLCAVNLNGYGEALLHPDIVKMVSYAKFKGLVDVFFHTNATRLDGAMSEKLIDAGLDRLVVSMDSPYREKYEAIRKGARFETVLKNIRDLDRLKREKGSLSPLTRINMIKFPDLQAREIEDMKKLLAEVVEIIGFLDFQEVEPNKMIKPDFSDDYRSPFSCPQLVSRMTVLADGSVAPCCVEDSGKIRLGNANQEALKDIWQGRKLAALRKKHQEGRFFEIAACAVCDWALKQDKVL